MFRHRTRAMFAIYWVPECSFCSGNRARNFDHTRNLLTSSCPVLHPETNCYIGSNYGSMRHFTIMLQVFAIFPKMGSTSHCSKVPQTIQQRLGQKFSTPVKHHRRWPKYGSTPPVRLWRRPYCLQKSLGDDFFHRQFTLHGILFPSF